MITKHDLSIHGNRMNDVQGLASAELEAHRHVRQLQGEFQQLLRVADVFDSRAHTSIPSVNLTRCIGQV